ncbi:hypothetical protein F5146DRAFT_1050332 [Armillaria mellea]|nr:hypothetical protein F5146DRAFT_1050332 [Armillaria mellea]
MTRITNDSISSNSHPSHRIRQKKTQKYQTASIVKSEPKEEQTTSLNISSLNSFSVPGRTHRSKWATITSADGSTTVVPNVYRIPLMFVGEFMWSSLRLVLGDDKEWNEFKTGILHVSRLCKAFLDEVRRAMSEEGVGRSWRCATFDRALAAVSYLKEFWEMYGDDEYRKDAVKLDWKRLVMKGLKGFKLDEEQIEGGVKANRWMSGLKEIRGTAQDYLESWQRTKLWRDRPAPPPISVDETLLPKTHALELCDPVNPPVPPGLACEPVRLPYPLHHPNSTSFCNGALLLWKTKSLQLRKSERMRATISLPETAVTFVPTPNFPEISDPDCSTSFWRNPLEQLLDMDTDADIHEDVTATSVKCEPEPEPAQMKAMSRSKDDVDNVASAPIKSLRKLQRMES